MDALSVDVVYSVRTRVVKVQNEPAVSFGGCERLTVKINVTFARVCDEAFSWNHGQSDPFQHSGRIDIEI